MKNLKLILFLGIFTIFSINSSAQCCCGKLLFSIIDPEQNITYPIPDNSTNLFFDDEEKPVNEYLEIYKDIKITTLEIINGAHCILIKSIKKEGETKPYFLQKTSCGIRLWHIEIQKGDKKMEIKFKNVRSEERYLIDSIPFKPGKYIIDFKNASNTYYENRTLKNGQLFRLLIVPITNFKNE